MDGTIAHQEVGSAGVEAPVMRLIANVVETSRQEPDIRRCTGVTVGRRLGGVGPQPPTLSVASLPGAEHLVACREAIVAVAAKPPAEVQVLTGRPFPGHQRVTGPI